MSSNFPPVPLGRVEANAVRIGEVLGGGRHGVVVSARTSRDDPDQTRLVLKIPTGAQTLNHEAEALRMLAHPNVVRLIDGPSRLGALLLERCELGTLEDRLLSDGEAAWALTQLTVGLAHIHRLGWVHADISPGNVGIRSDGSVVLLDFSTARHADESDVDEGTEHFAGNLRSANATLDLRCTAATIQARLTEPHSALGKALGLFLERCDETESATMAELLECISSVEVTPFGHEHHLTTAALPETPTCDIDPVARLSGDSPPRSTREFGPRPGPDPSPDQVEESGVHPAAMALLVLLVVAVVIAGRMAEVGRAPSPEAASMALAHFRTASETLDEANVDWENGIATVALDNSIRRFMIGEPSDIAAVGDWDCNGTETLGVYRPTTGSWFTFGSWEPDAMSTAANLGQGIGLLVEFEGDCATPRVQDR